MSQATPDYRALMTKALVEIKDLKARLARHEAERAEPIAIVGMACRFPGGSNSPEAYWRMLRNGVDAITEIPAERWDVDRFFDADRNAPGKAYSRWGGFIDDIAGFDAGFFAISPREAETLDPHQRILLEVCWDALEHANLVPENLFGSNTGVFIGVSSLDQILNLIGELPLSEIGPYHGSGCALAPIAGRISYNFGFNGPSFVMDTACSSSLLSLHLAAESLRRRECNQALAGGVHFLFHPGYFVAFSKAGMLSPDGRCKTFDASANGYVRGEGCGVMVLKRLSDAERDGDSILALIRGSAVNQDGASGGLTVPSGPSQEQVVRLALARGDIDPARVDYIEAHGTGTPLGDPIELGALGNVFSQPIWVGSVKTNIGHLEASAGIAGAMKVTLALQHGQIPPHLHLNKPNPLIPWAELPVRVPTRLTPWPAREGGRIAGISAFAFSGTNVHLVLAEAPPVAPAESSTAAAGEPGMALLPLSARSEDALRALARRWAEGPLAAPDADFVGLCATAALCRTAFSQRLGVVADSVESARRQLLAYAEGQTEGVPRGEAAEQARPRVAFLCTGQGAQYVNMGRKLYATQPVFRAALDECDRLLAPELGVSLLALIHPALDSPEAANLASRLDETAYTQPALFALEYSLARLWQSWGVRPAALLGHSVGEYVAACLAGVFSLADGLKLIAARARLMQALPAGGGMAALFAESGRVQAAIKRIGSTLVIAAYNGPRNTVVSGPLAELDVLLATLPAEGVEFRRLVVSHAFHSPLMAPMLEDFRRVAASIRYAPPNLPVVSNVTGDIVGAELASADYWVRHVAAPVRFAEGVATLRRQGISCFLELGPSFTLLGMARQNFEGEDAPLLLNSLKKGEPDARVLFAALADYWTHGGTVDWPIALGRSPRRDLRLPTYPFQHRRYWHHAQVDAARSGLHGVQALDLPLLARRLSSSVLRDHLFETVFSRTATPFIEDHRVYGQLVVAGASHLSLVLSAAAYTDFSRHGASSLREVMFPMALTVPEDSERVVQLVIQPQAGGVAEFRLLSLAGEGQEPVLHARGHVQPALAPAPAPDLRAIWQRCVETVEVEAVFALQSKRHIVVGPSYRWLTALRRGSGETIARLRAPEILRTTVNRYALHPGLIDSCFGCMVMTQSLEIEETFIPFSVEAVHYHDPALDLVEQELIAHAVVRLVDAQRMVGDIHIYSAEGAPLAAFIGLEGRRATRRALLSENATPVAAAYQLVWEVPATTNGLPALVGTWLLLADDGLGEALTERLRAGGARVVLARPDPVATNLVDAGAGNFRLAPKDNAAFTDLLAACGQLAGIIYLWGIGQVADEDGLTGLAAYQDSALAGALSLTQAISLARDKAGRLLFVSQKAQAAAGESVANPQQAQLWGLALALTQEMPEQPCLALDLNVSDSSAIATAVLAGLGLESVETRALWRSGQLKVARLQSLPAAAVAKPLFDPERVCLISGASGAIGAELASWLTASGVRRLALLGRREADAGLLARLAELGAEPRHYPVDVADRAALADVIDQIVSEQGPLGGIFHLAGVLDDGPLSGQTWVRWQRVLAAKVDGAWNLHQLTLGMDLAHFVAFSSIASLLGTPGQSSYAAANAGVDALVAHRRGLGLPGLSLHWGPWAEIGMAARLDAAQWMRMEQQGVYGLHTASALAQLGHWLAEPTAGPAVAVLAMDWSAYAESRGQPLPVLAHLAAVSTPRRAGLRQSLLERPAGERRSLLIAALVDMVAEALRMERAEVAPRERLFDLGVDSLAAIELKNRLQGALGGSLSSTLLFDYPTIEALASHLLEGLPSDSGTAAAAPTSAEALPARPDALETMSEAEAEALLLAQLARLES